MEIFNDQELAFIENCAKESESIDEFRSSILSLRKYWNLSHVGWLDYTKELWDCYLEDNQP